MGVYGPAIAGLNLVLVVSSTVLLYFGNVLITFYLLPTLDFVTHNFSSVPHLMLAVGILGLIGGSLGIVMGALANRAGLILHSVMLSLVFILQLASIFTTAELRSQLQHQILNQLKYDLYDVSTMYWTSPDFKDSWDEVQRTYACCGFHGFNTGYKDWKSGAHTLKDSVPDSCCHVEMSECGDNMILKLNAHTEIYTHGCLSVLESRMARDVQPVLTAYLGCGVVLAILMIIAIVLSSAYSAAITRRNKKQEERYTAVLGGERRSLYHFKDDVNPPILKDDANPPIIRDSGMASAAGSSKRSVYEDDDRVSRVSSSSQAREFRSSTYIEPTNEKGTVI